MPTYAHLSPLWTHHTQADMYSSCPTNCDPHLEQTGGCLPAFALSDTGGLLRPGGQDRLVLILPLAPWDVGKPLGLSGSLFLSIQVVLRFMK